MLDVGNNYWFYLESHVYCKITDKKSLLYNTLDGSRIAVSSDIVNNLIMEIHKDKNYGSIFIDKEMLRSNFVISFIFEAIDKHIGVVVPADSKTKKPIKPLPIFRLDNDVERYLGRGDEYTGKNILENLLVINLYVSNTCDTGCNGCDIFFKQTTCCLAQLYKPCFISKKQIDSIVSQLEQSSVARINILGGNIFNYPHLKFLVQKINEIGIEVSIWSHYSHIPDNLDSYDAAYLDVIVPPLVLEGDFVKAAYGISNRRAKYHFFVEKEVDVECVEEFISKYQLENYQLQPIFNGNNLAFFEKNVFIDMDDIFYKIFSYREIFAHQKLNTNYFGILNILSNGDVFADINSKPIGNIDTHKVVELIHKELLQNTAWRKLRDEEPCSGCLHQFICPSPSGYESAIGRSNLCHAFE